VVLQVSPEELGIGHVGLLSTPTEVESTLQNTWPVGLLPLTVAVHVIVCPDAGLDGVHFTLVVLTGGGTVEVETVVEVTTWVTDMLLIVVVVTVEVLVTTDVMMAVVVFVVMRISVSVVVLV
jgi:hypothetical protein